MSKVRASILFLLLCLLALGSRDVRGDLGPDCRDEDVQTLSTPDESEPLATDDDDDDDDDEDDNDEAPEQPQELPYDPSEDLFSNITMGACKDVLQMLRSNQSLVRLRDLEQSTALHVAAVSNRPTIVRFLLNYSAEVDAVDEASRTPLQLAAERGNQEIVELLLNAGANIDAQDEDGRTAFIVALGLEHPEVARFLVQKGANSSFTDSDQRTCLHLAAGGGYLDIMENCSRIFGLDARDSCNNTPLHYCALNGKRTACKWLLEQGATDSIINCQNRSAQDASRRGSSVATEMLLETFHNNETLNFFASEDNLRKILSETRLSTMKIVQYRDFLFEFPSLRVAVKEDLDNITLVKESLNITAGNISELARVDELIDGARLNAKTWNDIFISMRTVFVNINVFGDTFRQSFNMLDEKLPGVLADLSETEIQRRLSLEETDLRLNPKIGRSKRKKLLDNFEAELRSKNALSKKDRVELKKFLNYTLLHSDKYQENAKNLSAQVTEFRGKLIMDKTNFQLSTKILSEMHTMTRRKLSKHHNKTIHLKEKLNITSKSVETTIDAIGAILKTQAYYSIALTTMNLVSFGIRVPQMIKGGVDSSLKIYDKGYYLYSKNAAKKCLEVRKGSFDFRPKVYATDSVRMKQEARATRWKSIKSKVGNFLGYKGLPKLGKFGKFMKASPAVLGAIAGPILDITSLALSIAQLVEQSKKQDEFGQLQKNLTVDMENFKDTFGELAAINAKLGMITLTKEAADAIAKNLTTLIEKVQGAIDEAENLECLWRNIHFSLLDLYSRADETNRETLQEITQHLKIKLRQMNQSWIRFGRHSKALLDFFDGVGFAVEDPVITDEDLSGPPTLNP